MKRFKYLPARDYSDANMSDLKHDLAFMTKIADKEKGLIEVELREVHDEFKTLEHILELLDRLEKDAAELSKLFDQGDKKAARRKAEAIREDVYFLFRFEHRLSTFNSIAKVQGRIKKFAVELKFLIVRTGADWDTNKCMDSKTKSTLAIAAD